MQRGRAVLREEWTALAITWDELARHVSILGRRYFEVEFDTTSDASQVRRFCPADKRIDPFRCSSGC